MSNKSRILFVCLGNICRSPAAEGIFSHLVNQAQLTDNFIIDSAGTSGHHDGELPDKRMRQAASRRDLDLTSISRKFIAEDLTKFDYIVVMDDSNYENVLQLDHSNEFGDKIYKMADYTDEKYKEFVKIPDPYFGGEDGFDLVLDLLENTCKNFLIVINEKK